MIDTEYDYIIIRELLLNAMVNEVNESIKRIGFKCGNCTGIYDYYIEAFSKSADSYDIFYRMWDM